MASTSAAAVYDLVSWAKLRDPGMQNIAVIAELLNQANEQVYDATWMEGDLPLGTQVTQRTALPTVYTALINQPTQVSRGQTAQFQETAAIIRGWQETDLKLLNLQGDKGAFLFQEMKAQTEAMTELWSLNFWYGNPANDPTQYLGLAPRYAALSGYSNSQNVINGGGSSNVNTSLWLVTHSPTATTMFFPRGGSSGIERTEFPNGVVYGSAGVGTTRLAVYQCQYEWTSGMALHDWRWTARLANIDSTNLKNQTGATDLTEGMIDLITRMPSGGNPAFTTGNPTSSLATPGKQAFYCNRTVRAALEKQALQKASNQLTVQDWFGRKILHFRDIPIRNSDQITNAESTIS